MILLKYLRKHLFSIFIACYLYLGIFQYYLYITYCHISELYNDKNKKHHMEKMAKKKKNEKNINTINKESVDDNKKTNKKKKNEKDKHSKKKKTIHHTNENVNNAKFKKTDRFGFLVVSLLLLGCPITSFFIGFSNKSKYSNYDERFWT